MTLLIGESSYYRSDCARLLVTLIIIIIFETEKVHHMVLAGLDIVEFPLNVNGKNC